MRNLKAFRAVMLGIGAAVLLIGMPFATTPASAAHPWKVSVAMYHIVTPNAPDSSLTGLFVRTTEFDAQLKAAAAKGIRAITAHDLAASVNAGVTIPAKTMVLTFDDGRVECLTYAWPIMQKYGASLVFRGTKWISRDMNADGKADKGYIGSFYVIVGRVGGKYLSYDQEGLLAKGGNEIANHTNSHVNVSVTHGAALTFQVITAGHTIETEVTKRGVVLGTAFARGTRFIYVRGGRAGGPVPVTTFVYPYGTSSAEAISLLKANGYQMAFTTVEGMARSGLNPLLLPRVRIDRGDSAAAFLKAMGL